MIYTIAEEFSDEVRSDSVAADVADFAATTVLLMGFHYLVDIAAVMVFGMRFFLHVQGIGASECFQHFYLLGWSHIERTTRVGTRNSR